MKVYPGKLIRISKSFPKGLRHDGTSRGKQHCRAFNPPQSKKVKLKKEGLAG